MSVANVNQLPRWTIAAPVAAAVLASATFAGPFSAESAVILVLAALLLAAAVFAAVHHAEVIAMRVGEPYGSIVLALAVTVIEGSLILSLMLADPSGSQTLARDTVFATVMIVLTGVVGLCLVAGGARHRQQAFGTDAVAASLSTLGTLAVITLVLPNFALGVPGPQFASTQLFFVGAFSILLYAVFLFVQTVRHRTFFLDVQPADAADSEASAPIVLPTNGIAIASLALLTLSLAAVVMLAKALSPTLERAIDAAGLPAAFAGVVIAAVVLTPESIAAVRAAKANRLQSALNLALGSALATIGLTIPLVAAAALWLEMPLLLGLGSAEMVLLVLALFISTISLATGRTTILQGAVHLVLFAVFVLLAVVP